MRVINLIQQLGSVQSAPLELIVVVTHQNPALSVQEIKLQPRKEVVQCPSVVRLVFPT